MPSVVRPQGRPDAADSAARIRQFWVLVGAGARGRDAASQAGVRLERALDAAVDLVRIATASEFDAVVDALKAGALPQPVAAVIDTTRTEAQAA